MPVSRAGLTVVERLVSSHDAGHPAVVVAIEATGSLHRAWSSALERSYPGGPAVRSVGDQGGSDSAGVGPVQDR
jgi:hypothetical protein